MTKSLGNRISLTAISISIAIAIVFTQLILTASPSDARGPVVRGTFEISRSAPTQLPTPGVGCSEVDGNDDGIADTEPEEFYDENAENEYLEIKWYIHDNCIADDYTGLDPSGPPIIEFRITLISTVSGLPAGWGVCEDSMAYQSFSEHERMGLVSIPLNQSAFEQAGYIFGAGGSGPINSTQYSEEAGGYSYLGNTRRPSFVPWALVCGPDPSVPSGIGWKSLQGKAVTLPAISRWPISEIRF